jgi:trigger factor
MDATFSTLEDNKVKLVVTITEEEMDIAIDLTANKLAKQVSIKGFRKGKVPKPVLEAHLGGREALRGEALRDALPDYYAVAVSDTLIDPIAQPSMTITSGEESGPVTFEAEVEVRPQVEIAGYQNLRVTIPAVDVTDDEVNAQIDRYRDADSVLEDVDRPIVTNDIVQLDVTVARVDEADQQPFTIDDYMYTVGAGDLVPGIDELIVGLKAGEELTMSAPLGGNIVANYTLKIKQVKNKVLPELTDEWVAGNTDYPSIDDLYNGIANQMREMKIVEAQLSQRDAVLVALSDLIAEDDLPESLVNDETQERLHDLGHRLADQKLDLGTFLKVTNQTDQQLLEKLRSDAVRGVRVDLALRALVRAEGLEPSEEEIAEELGETAMSMDADLDALYEQLREAGRWPAFVSEVAKLKASKWIMNAVTFVDPQGVEIDRSVFAKNQAVDAGDEPGDDL